MGVPMNSFMRLAAVVIMVGSGFGQDADETLQLKNGQLVRGTVVSFDDTGITMKSGGVEVKYPYEQCHAYSAYELRWKKLNKDSADDHRKQGEFCKKYGLLSTAITEYREAIARDPNLKERLEEEIRNIRTEEARRKYEEARSILLQKKEDRYREASRLLAEVLRDYDDTPYFEEARKLEKQLAEEIKRFNEDAQKKAEAAKKDKEEAEKQKKIKEPLETASRLYDEGLSFWHQGLDIEAGKTPNKALDSWINADYRLGQAREKVNDVLKVAKDPDVLSLANQLAVRIDRATVRNCLSIALMSAADVGNYSESMRWINKALKIDPDNEAAWKLKLDLKEAIMRMRLETSTKKN